MKQYKIYPNIIIRMIFVVYVQILQGVKNTERNIFIKLSNIAGIKIVLNKKINIFIEKGYG